MSWNKGRLAYTPLGPFVAQLYLEGLSYGKIAQEVGIDQGCVQRLCKVMGIPPRTNRTTNIPDVWEQRLSDYVNRTGAKVIGRPGRLTKKSRILTECDHGISERPCQVLEGMTFCCKSGSKTGVNNPGEGWGVRSHYRCLPGTLYLVNYRDEDGDHIKVGITKRTVEERLRSRLVSVIATYEATLGECFDLEQKILKDLDEFRYSSQSTTELFTTEALPLILNYYD